MTDGARPFSWGRFDDAFVADLAHGLRGLRVLEVFAGNGLLASRLAAHGVDVLATSLRADHDRHADGFLHPVLELDAVSAVRTLGHGRDVLLMSWPTTDAAAARCALAWGEGRPVVFVGEVTRPRKDPSSGPPTLGGCADDAFFALMSDVEPIRSYAGRNALDAAFRATVRVPDDVHAHEVDWSAFRAVPRPEPPEPNRHSHPGVDQTTELRRGGANAWG